MWLDSKSRSLKKITASPPKTSSPRLRGRWREVHALIRVETTPCALSPPKKHLGGAGWGEAGDTTRPPQKILEWHSKKSQAAPFYQLASL